MLDRGKGFADADEDGGSRSYPSRTKFGAAFVDRKQLQWLVMPRYIFGLWRVSMYEYYWGHTAAQIQLMIVDAPLTVYQARKDKPKPGEKGFTRTAEQAAREYDRWKKRQEEEKKRGVKIDLNTFLSTGEKKKI